MSEPLAFLNGQWIPASSASVPIDNAGFVQGTTVAERARTFAGRIFRLQDHLSRLARSLEIIGVDPGMELSEFARVAEELVVKNHPLLPSGGDLGLSIVVAPGVGTTFDDDERDMPAAFFQPAPAASPKKEGASLVCLHTSPLPFRHWAEKYRDGQRLVTTEVRQVPVACWPAELKCRSRMHYYLADREAAARDPQARALLLDADGFVAEASTATLLVYRDAEGLLSPPEDKILHGISMSATWELAQRLGVAVGRRNLTVEDVASADEVMLASTSPCLLPVTRLNGQPIGNGRPGRVFSDLMAAWSGLVGIDILEQAARQSV